MTAATTNVELVQGDLLTAEVEALVNAVNLVGVMGKGIALQFKRAYPENFAAYAEACRVGDVRIGRVLAHRTAREVPRWILNVPTKRHWRDRSRLDDVVRGIDALVEEVVRREIRSIAVPALGCGEGGLPWAVMRAVIEGAFAPVDARVLLFVPVTRAPRKR